MTPSSHEHLPLPADGPFELDIDIDTDIDPAIRLAFQTMIHPQPVMPATVAERRKGTPPVVNGHSPLQLNTPSPRPTRSRSATSPDVDVDLLDIDFLIDLARFPKPQPQPVHTERSWANLSDDSDDDNDAASVESSLLPDHTEWPQQRVTTLSATAKWHRSVGLGLGANDHFHLDDFPLPPVTKPLNTVHRTGSPRGEWRDRDSMPDSPVVTTPVTPLMSPPLSPNKAAASQNNPTSPIRCPTAQRCYFTPPNQTASSSPTSAFGGVSPRSQVKTFNKPYSPPVSRPSLSPGLSLPPTHLLSLAETTSEGGWEGRRESRVSNTSSGCVSSSHYSISTYNESIQTPPLLTFQPLPPLPTNGSRNRTHQRRSSIHEHHTTTHNHANHGGESAMLSPASTGTSLPDQGEREYSLNLPGSATPTPTRKLSIARSVAQSVGGTSTTSSTMSKGDLAKHDDGKAKGERAQVDRPHEEHRMEADAGHFVEGCAVCDRMAEAWRRRKAMFDRKKAAASSKPPKAKKEKASKADTASRSSLDTGDAKSLSRTNTQQSTSTFRFTRGGGGHAAPPELPPLPPSYGALQPHDNNAQGDGHHHQVCTTCGCRPADGPQPGDAAAHPKGKLFQWRRGAAQRS